MRFHITSDSSWEAKIDHARKPLKVAEFFSTQNYGSDIQAISIILMCRNTETPFKQRKRYNKETKELYLDIMLDFKKFASTTHAERRSMLAMHLMEDIPAVIAIYKLKDFNLESFKKDLSSLVQAQLLSPESAAHDHLCAERAPGF